MPNIFICTIKRTKSTNNNFRTFGTVNSINTQEYQCIYPRVKNMSSMHSQIHKRT